MLSKRGRWWLEFNKYFSIATMSVNSFIGDAYVIYTAIPAAQWHDLAPECVPWTLCHVIKQLLKAQAYYCIGELFLPLQY